MIIETYPAGPFRANCYIVGDEKTNEGFLIDPSGDPEGIMKLIKNIGLHINFILLTHGHGDHFTGAYRVKNELKVKLYVNKNDQKLVEGETRDLIPILKNMTLVDVDGNIKDGDVFEVGNMKIEIIETPGHTMGGVCIKVGNNIFTGDTIFKGSIGRCDIGDASQDILISSIKNKLMKFEDNVVLYPGHGMKTTVGYERINNPFIN